MRPPSSPRTSSTRVRPFQLVTDQNILINTMHQLGGSSDSCPSLLLPTNAETPLPSVVCAASGPSSAAIQKHAYFGSSKVPTIIKVPSHVMMSVTLALRAITQLQSRLYSQDGGVYIVSRAFSRAS